MRFFSISAEEEAGPMVAMIFVFILYTLNSLISFSVFYFDIYRFNVTDLPDYLQFYLLQEIFSLVNSK
jgi:hypothetical protein